MWQTRREDPMTRIDRHVARVRSKLTVGIFVRAMAMALLIYAGVVWINILVDRLLLVHLPKWDLLFWIGLGVSIATALGYALWRRPTDRIAAVAIDEKLGLKEKFSTALYARQLNSPFAAATVRDAEAAADGVNLHGKFKLQFPRAGYWAIAAFGAVLLTYQLDRQHLFASPVQVAKKAHQREQSAKEAKEVIKKAIATVEQAPKSVADDEKIALAKKELDRALTMADKDPVAAKRTALKAAQEMQDAIKEQIKNNQKYAQAKANDEMFKEMKSPPLEEKGPVADAHRAIAKGDFSQAVDDLSKTVANFDKMDQKEQEKAADQMKDMAKQLQAMANDPKVQQQIKDQLKQMGANDQQAKDIAKKIQQAANGDKQAQQQLQQMQKQLTQQMNNGQGPNPQQQQQIQNMMKQMQAQANTQAGAQAMAKSALKMANAMQQQSSGQQQKNPNQQNQPGQQNKQQMAQGQQQMQQQLQQMQATQKDMQQMAAAQNAAQQGAQAAKDALNGQQPGGQNGQGGQQQANGQGQGQNPGQNAGQQGGNQNGPGGQGVAAGLRPKGQAAPFTIQQEMSERQDNEKGKILASRWVKAGSFKGESKAELSDVAASVEQAQTDEVQQERITGAAREAQKRYFNSLQEEAP
jgi:hypothetical protein